ncbi:transposase family protein [Streptomyces sp. NPDC054834]
MPDPRCRQCRRYRLGALLALCALAVLGGASTLVAIGRFATGAPEEVRTRLGMDGRMPRACTRGPLLAGIDGDALNAAVGSRLACQLGSSPAARPSGRRSSTGRRNKISRGCHDVKAHPAGLCVLSGRRTGRM